MASAGVELIVGVVGDPRFGPLVAVGAGGTTAELIGDVQVRLAPVGPREAAAMLRELRTFPLLDGFRGAPRADAGAVGDIIERVSALAAAHPEIAELDCNPVVASSDGAVIVDARIRLVPAPDRPPVGALNR
jgi:acetate---CoA ligase (ADP-forming)